jgi:hypothetical protein
MESPPLARFLHSLGKVQHHLHTIVVGLSSVESGIATKPDDLDITWKANDLIGSAREARRFLLKAALIFVAEEIQAYATDVLEYQGLEIDDYKLPETQVDRIRALAKPNDVKPNYLTVASLIVANWRNRIVHRDSTAHLTAAEQDCLLAKSESIRDSYKGIDVLRLLQDFESNKPTLKDVTVLVAMSIRFVRHIDASLPELATSRDVRRWLEAEGLLGDVLKLEKEATNGGHPNPRGRAKQYLLTRAPSLAEAYHTHGASGEP